MSGDPKFSHLADELHVEVSAFATPAEAHARVAYALAELRRFLVPVSDPGPAPVTPIDGQRRERTSRLIACIDGRLVCRLF